MTLRSELDIEAVPLEIILVSEVSGRYVAPVAFYVAAPRYASPSKQCLAPAYSGARTGEGRMPLSKPKSPGSEGCAGTISELQPRTRSDHEDDSRGMEGDVEQAGARAPEHADAGRQPAGEPSLGRPRR